MANQVDLDNSSYSNFKEPVLADIRRKTYGEEQFAGLQNFLSTVHRLTSEEQRSVFVFLTEKER